MEQRIINFRFEGRYFQLGKMGKDTKNLIFVLHGYGQQAKYFIQKFKGLETSENCIIAPEGLSRFYLEGFSGRVGATWMTKEERLTDIKNYLSYLNSIYSTITDRHNDIKISIIGFSQGAATASRWAADHTMYFDQLILWAGIFPPDMNFEKDRENFKNKSIFYVYGTRDPFLSEEKLIEMRELSDRLHISPKVLTFDGEHDVDHGTLAKIFNDA